MRRVNGSVKLWHEAVYFFNEHVVTNTPDDPKLLRAKWIEYVDYLYRTNQISGWQAHNWSCPVHQMRLSQR